MKRYEFPKVLVENPLPPEDTSMIWIDIDENTKKLKWMKEFNKSTQQWEKIVSSSSDAEEAEFYTLKIVEGVVTYVSGSTTAIETPAEYGADPIHFPVKILYGDNEAVGYTTLVSKHGNEGHPEQSMSLIGDNAVIEDYIRSYSDGVWGAWTTVNSGD